MRINNYNDEVKNTQNIVNYCLINQINAPNLISPSNTSDQLLTYNQINQLQNIIPTQNLSLAKVDSDSEILRRAMSLDRLDIVDILVKYGNTPNEHTLDRILLANDFESAKKLAKFCLENNLKCDFNSEALPLSAEALKAYGDTKRAITQFHDYIHLIESDSEKYHLGLTKLGELYAFAFIYYQATSNVDQTKARGKLEFLANALELYQERASLWSQASDIMLALHKYISVHHKKLPSAIKEAFTEFIDESIHKPWGLIYNGEAVCKEDVLNPLRKFVNNPELRALLNLK